MGAAGKPSYGDHLSVRLSLSQAALRTKDWRPPLLCPGVLRQAPGLTGPFSPSGKPYSEEWTAKWSYLYSLATKVPNSGSFTFIPQPAPQQYQRWEVGALRIVSSKHYEGER